MAKKITIYDDTVLKLSIKQGTEEQRTEMGDNSFTSGELAYTRDTGRVFVGDNSDANTNNTIGGSLVGNKYLGMIDTRQSDTIISDEIDTTPKNFVEILSNEDTDYKESYIKDDDKKHWNRNATYNSTYDAYNGDIIYDKYQNALILFDKNIEVSNTSEAGEASSTTKFINYTTNKADVSSSSDISELEKDTSVNSFYDGFVVFKNIIPDNETLEFIPKHFNEDGSVKNFEDTNNPYFNNNVLRIKESYIDKIKNYTFDDNFVIISTDETTSVTLNDTIRINEIAPKDDYSDLNLATDNLKINNVRFNFSNISKSGFLYAEGNKTDGFNLQIKEQETFTSGAVHYFKKPIYLAWTDSSTITDTTSLSEHLNALLEYRIIIGRLESEGKNNIICNKKILNGQNILNWSVSSNPIDSPKTYFTTDTNIKNNLWNRILMVRGNNSFASLLEDVKYLEGFYQILTAEITSSINTSLAANNTETIISSSLENIIDNSITLKEIYNENDLKEILSYEYGNKNITSTSTYKAYYNAVKEIDGEIGLYQNFVMNFDGTENYFLIENEEVDEEDYMLKIENNKVGWLYYDNSTLKIHWVSYNELGEDKKILIPTNYNPIGLIVKININETKGDRYIYYKTTSINNVNFNKIYTFNNVNYDDRVDEFNREISENLVNASSLILSLDRSFIPNNFNTETEIFVSDSLDSLKMPSGTENMSYTHSNNPPITNASNFNIIGDTAKAIAPNIDNNNNMFLEGNNESKITSTTFEIPLYDINGYRGFAIRLANIMFNDNTNNYFTALKLIGYR